MILGQLRDRYHIAIVILPLCRPFGLDTGAVAPIALLFQVRMGFGYAIRSLAGRSAEIAGFLIGRVFRWIITVERAGPSPAYLIAIPKLFLVRPHSYLDGLFEIKVTADTFAFALDDYKIAEVHVYEVLLNFVESK